MTIVASNTSADAAAGALLSIRDETERFEMIIKKEEMKLFDNEKSSVGNMTPFLANNAVPTEVSVSRKRKSSSGAMTTDDAGPNDPTQNDMKRQYRLEQNRKAAKISRERKKSMIDDIHRSISQITSANAKLQLQNTELEKLLEAAQCLLGNSDSHVVVGSSDNVVAQHTALSGVQQQPPLSIQAMMSFQQAAANAMQAAMVSNAMSQMKTESALLQQRYSSLVQNPQQVYMDHLSALAIKQSLGNAISSVPAVQDTAQQVNLLGHLPLQMGQFFLWQQQQQQQQVQQAQQ